MGDAPRKRKKIIQVRDNLRVLDWVVLCASEISATAILLFVGCMGCIDTMGTPPSHLQVCLNFGLAVMVSLQCFAHLSGSHINPSLTVVAATIGRIPLIRVPIYFAGQFLGAFLGFGLLKAVTPSKYIDPYYKSQTVDGVVLKVYHGGVCSPGINALIGPMRGLLIEFLVTFILGLVACAVWDVRNKVYHDSVSLRFGLAVTVLALAAGPYTGANMNPARSLAPAAFNGDWKHHWVYWVGPLAGGFLSALFYRVVFGIEPEFDDDED